MVALAALEEERRARAHRAWARQARARRRQQPGSLGRRLRRAGRARGAALPLARRRASRPRRLGSATPSTPACGADARAVLTRLAPIEPRAGADPDRTPTSTGEPARPAASCDAAYWVPHVREPVRFADGDRGLSSRTASTPSSSSAPDPVLTVALEETAATLPPGPRRRQARSLRRRSGSRGRFLAALGAAHVGGAEVEWRGLLAGQRPKRVALPHLPLPAPPLLAGGTGPGRRPGRDRPGRDRAPAARRGRLPRPASEQHGCFTGRLSLQSHPWLADHAVHGTAILPGAAFVELALSAGEQVGRRGAGGADARGAARPRRAGRGPGSVGVGEPEEDGRRSSQIHSRADGRRGRGWARNASRLSLRREEPAGEPPGRVAARRGRARRGRGLLSSALADARYRLRPRLPGPRRRLASRRGALRRGRAGRRAQRPRQSASGSTRPCSTRPSTRLSRRRARGRAARPLRFGGRATVWRRRRPRCGCASSPAPATRSACRPADADGAPVPRSSRSPCARVEPAQLPTAQAPLTHSLRSDWSELRGARGRVRGELPPCALRVRSRPRELDPPAAAQALCAEVLARLQAAISPRASRAARGSPSSPGARSPSREGESPDPAAAAVWGLVRSAQAEHPGRFLLIDSDGSEASQAALEAALASGEEPQLALREGKRPGAPAGPGAGAGGGPGLARPRRARCWSPAPAVRSARSSPATWSAPTVSAA